VRVAVRERNGSLVGAHRKDNKYLFFWLASIFFWSFIIYTFSCTCERDCDLSAFYSKRSFVHAILHNIYQEQTYKAFQAVNKESEVTWNVDILPAKRL